MKNTILISLFCLFFILSPEQIRGQHSSMNFHMQSHMQAVRTHQQMASNFQNMVLMQQRMGSIRKTSAKYQFTIVTTTGDTIVPKKKIKVQFNDWMKEISFKTKEGKQTYKLEDTQALFVDGIKAIENDSCWIFNMYNTRDAVFYTPYPEYEVRQITYYKTADDKKIKKLDVESMKVLAARYPKVLKDLEKKKLGNAIQRYMREEQKYENAQIKALKKTEKEAEK